MYEDQVKDETYCEAPNAINNGQGKCLEGIPIFLLIFQLYTKSFNVQLSSETDMYHFSKPVTINWKMFSI
jgi:hypothetical protein